MYDIRRIDERKWSITTNKTRSFVGSLKEVCQVAVGIGLSIDEIEYALTEMAWMDHDVAHFGIYKGFIFSYDTKEKRV
jgi:hypothetical protein